MFTIFRKRIIPEVLLSYKIKLPDKISVVIKNIGDDYYFVRITDLQDCVTQAKAEEIFEMVNDAIYTYFEIPQEYQPFVQTYIPPENIRKELKIKIPEGELELCHV